MTSKCGWICKDLSGIFLRWSPYKFHWQRDQQAALACCQCGRLLACRDAPLRAGTRTCCWGILRFWLVFWDPIHPTLGRLQWCQFLLLLAKSNSALLACSGSIAEQVPKVWIQGKSAHSLNTLALIHFGIVPYYTPLSLLDSVLLLASVQSDLETYNPRRERVVKETVGNGVTGVVSSCQENEPES